MQGHLSPVYEKLLAIKAEEETASRGATEATARDAVEAVPAVGQETEPHAVEAALAGMSAAGQETEQVETGSVKVASSTEVTSSMSGAPVNTHLVSVAGGETDKEVKIGRAHV